MSPSKASNSDSETPTFSPEVRVNEAGDYVLGFEKDGAFVPLTTKIGVYVDAAVSRHERIQGGVS